MNYEPYYSEGWKNNEEGGTPITAASLNHVDDGLLDHDEDLQNIFGDMATLEEDETASQSYAVGDYLILDGLLYKVTTAISSGGTIAPGTNVVQTTVSAELGELNSKTTLTVATSSASAAQSIPSGSVKDFSINVAKSGKTAIAVIGLYPGYPATVSVRWFRLLYDTQIVECRLWNHHTSELTTNITITCLYVG